MRPQRKRTLSKVLIEAQETEAVRTSPVKRLATNGKNRTSNGRPPLYPASTPLYRSEDVAPSHPPVDAGIADEEWKSLCQILSESARHEKGSGERSMCLEKLYSDLRKIYSARAISCQEADGERPPEGAGKEEEKVEELKVEDLVKVEVAEAWGRKEDGTAASIVVEVHSPTSEPLSNAETPTQQSPTRRSEKLAHKFEEEGTPLLTRKALR
mmetsp:Transcript_4783/g.11068  ORF Transcript_4783/g.11068 Transcript_4783/m.11068 type:complete len:212 (+) Transcript_4783:301-936(+)